MVNPPLRLHLREALLEPQAPDSFVSWSYFSTAFERKGYRNWGTTMVDDMTDAVDWAIGQGAAALFVAFYGAQAAGLLEVARSLGHGPRAAFFRVALPLARLKPLLDLDQFHATFLKMNASGVVFVAALNGTTFPSLGIPVSLQGCAARE